jgi:hypothetical protein
MTKSVAFTTSRGSKVTVSLVTEQAKVADHTMFDARWDLTVRVNDGVPTGYNVALVDHPTAGRCISIGSNLAAVPADALAEIEALFAEYKAGVDARHSNWADEAKADAAYRANYRRIASDGYAA